MPPRKKQKTTENSSVPAGDGQEAAGHPQERAQRDTDESADDGTDERLDNLPPYEYITIPVPEFEFEDGPSENDQDDAADEEDEYDDPSHRRFQKVYDEEGKNNVLLQPASQHEGRKWVMLNQGWKTFCEWMHRASYCSPDAFDMYIYNDFEGYGVVELLENLLVSFDQLCKKKDEEEPQWGLWSVLSAMALWMASGGGDQYMMVDHAERVVDLSTLVGIALLTGLAMVEEAGELKPGSKFKDLGIVITSFLKIADMHPDCCMEESISWHQHIVTYFKKSGMGPEHGIQATSKLLEKYKGEPAPAPVSEKDPWGWDKRFRAYKKQYATAGGRIGGNRFDITKWTRKDRAKYAFNKKDPLAKFSVQDLRDGVVKIVRM